MSDEKTPSRFEELMRRMSLTKQFPIDLQPFNPAAPLEKAAAGEETEPPLYSAEWFRWVEGKYLGDDYLKASPAKKTAAKGD